MVQKGLNVVTNKQNKNIYFNILMLHVEMGRNYAYL